MKISFLGMSHLGIVSSVVAASKGLEVVCFDEDKIVINNLKNDLFPIEEKNLKKTFSTCKNNIKFTNEIKDLKSSDIFFISKDVLTDEENNSDFTDVLRIFEILYNINTSESAVVLHSQVPPGFCKKISKNFRHFYYQVETLIFGEAIERASNPERLIVGSLKEDINNFFPKYRNYLNLYNCKIFTMNLESAELTKLSINLFLISSITYANIMDKISSEINAEWSSIIPALKSDKRIGQYSYINPGLGLSGGNLERDIINISKITKNMKLENNFFKMLIDINENKKKWPVKRIKWFIENFNYPKKIAILGLSYKPGTNSYKNSPTLTLLEELKISNNYIIYDPNDITDYRVNELSLSNDLNFVLKDADIICIMSPLSEFEDLQIKYLHFINSARMIIDPFKILEKTKINKNIYYFFN